MASILSVVNTMSRVREHFINEPKKNVANPSSEVGRGRERLTETEAGKDQRLMSDPEVAKDQQYMTEQVISKEMLDELDRVTKYIISTFGDGLLVAARGCNR
ncbi:hypothetical protein [Burkholderia sp. 572]|uniref:hypothetical protein n=1 Tax=Burkholderia sp. 572 TaxID=3156414 RepID=UPI003397A8C8